MAETEEAFLRQCETQGICPACRGALTSRVGSGARSKGVFCSLKCFGDWHAGDLWRRHLERLKEQGERS